MYAFHQKLLPFPTKYLINRRVSSPTLIQHSYDFQNDFFCRFIFNLFLPLLYLLQQQR